MTNLQSTTPTLYGPPPRLKHSCSVKVIVGALLGGIVAWLIGDCSNFSQSSLYGPPPIDTNQTVSHGNNE